MQVLTLCGTGDSYSHATTIGMLPDMVLLEIFDLYRSNRTPSHVQWWSLLAHVCRNWRQIVLESPRRLNLQIRCTHKTPVKKRLGIWPAFPIVIDYHPMKPMKGLNDEKNIIAALKHSSRVSFIKLQMVNLYEWEEKNILAAMQSPFPVLTHLDMDEIHSVLPDDFLGGSAPCLQELTLSSISYPALPTLLLSTPDLIKLDLSNMDYVSPEAMVVSLTALPKLETLVIVFWFSTYFPESKRHPPLTRTILPALTSFRFNGASKYLEDLVARIDCPRLNQIVITYLNQVVDCQVTQFSNFIDRTVGPEITLFKHARFTFSYPTVAFTVYPHAKHSPWDRRPATNIISCEGKYCSRQVSHIAQVLGHMSANLSNVIHLKLKVDQYGFHLRGTDDVEWVLLLNQFSTLQTLHVSRELAGYVALALEDIPAEMVDEVLPCLDLLCVAGQPASSIEKFTTARRLSDHPVTIVETETEFDERLESYISK